MLVSGIIAGNGSPTPDTIKKETIKKFLFNLTKTAFPSGISLPDLIVTVEGVEGKVGIALPPPDDAEEFYTSIITSIVNDFSNINGEYGTKCVLDGIMTNVVQRRDELVQVMLSASGARAQVQMMFCGYTRQHGKKVMLTLWKTPYWLHCTGTPRQTDCFARRNTNSN